MNMSITRVSVYKYLCMTLDLRTPGDLRVIIVYYLKGVLEDFPEVIMGRRTSLEGNDLFQVMPKDKRMLLEKEWETAFHTWWNS